MKSNKIYIAVLSALVLSGCGSKLDANNKNFANAIDLALENLKKQGKNNLCVWIPTFPRTILLDDSINYSHSFQDEPIIFSKKSILSLQNNDLISSAKDNPTFYNLTDLGNKYYALNPRMRNTGELCYGHYILDKVVKWEWEGDSHQKVLVTYLVKIDNLPNWAKSPDMQSAFIDLRKPIETVQQEQKVGLKLTSIGWEIVMTETDF